jgi:hypothetical protein
MRPDTQEEKPNKAKDGPPDTTQGSRPTRKASALTSANELTASTVTQGSAATPPIVVTTTYRPAGRRHRWLAVIEDCPHCGEAHAHFGTVHGPPSGRRVAGCGRSYKLHPVFGGASDAEDVAVNR